MASAYLVYSPGFIPEFLFWLVCLGLVVHTIHSTPDFREPLAVVYDEFLVKIMGTAAELQLWSVIGLLSSACCAFQMILNLFSVGCAGFNTTLGPLRPFFLALCLLGQVAMWRNIERPELQMRTAYAATALAMVLSFLPEVIDFMHKVFRPPSPEKKASATSVELAITGMGCVACVDATTKLLNSRKDVKQVEVDLKKERGFVELTSSEDKESTDKTLKDICEAMEDIGFPTTVVDGSTTQHERTAAKGTGANGAIDDDDMTLKSGASTFQAFIAGLLGSSCCIAQLILNCLSALDLVHVGCAGFNKSLGPLRNVIRSLTVGWLGFLWMKLLLKERASGGQKAAPSCCTKFRRRLTFSTALALMLTFLPELLKFTNGVLPALAPPTDNLVRKTFVVDNMGCEACEAAVGRILSQHPGVAFGQVTDFGRGEAEVFVAPDWSFNETELDGRLQHHGYELHELGWETKNMKALAQPARKSSRKTLPSQQ